MILKCERFWYSPHSPDLSNHILEQLEARHRLKLVQNSVFIGLILLEPDTEVGLSERSKTFPTGTRLELATDEKDERSSSLQEMVIVNPASRAITRFYSCATKIEPGCYNARHYKGLTRDLHPSVHYSLGMSIAYPFEIHSFSNWRRLSTVSNTVSLHFV